MSDFKLTDSDFDDCSTIIVLSERAKKFWNEKNYKDRIVVGNSSQNIFVINNYERVRICDEIRENDMDFTS
tara:strand:+ start:539 stop:751 length:213 start_codon:yes stop_codon:yes gene_type:complete